MSYNDLFFSVLYLLCLLFFSDMCKKQNKKNINIQNIQKLEMQLNKDKNPIDTIYDRIDKCLQNHSITLNAHHKSLLIALITLILEHDKDYIKNNKLDDKNGSYVAKSMIDTIQLLYKDQYLSSAFYFLLDSIHNKYLLELVELIKNNLFLMFFDIDIMDNFYNMICDYDKNNNDKKNGVVITPRDVVKIMANMFEIYDNDVIADFTSGTGTILRECNRINENITLIGCENNIERYALMKCNFLLSKIDTRYLYHSSCFDVKFMMCDKIFLNPPFCGGECCEDSNIEILPWKKFKNEQRFVIYALQYLKLNGNACVIIPTSNLTETTNDNREFKKVLIDNNFQILRTILCNSNIFIPNASVGCSILALQKVEHYDFEYETELVDYTNDGYQIQKGKRIQIDNPVMKKYYKILDYDNSWIYHKTIDNDKCVNVDKDTELLKLAQEYREKLIAIEKKYYKKPINNYQYETYKLMDIATKITKYKKFNETNIKPGIYPLYGATKSDIPKCYINDYSIDSDEPILCINKTGNGGGGICFIRSGKFAVLNTVQLFKLKIKLSDQNLVLLSHQLHLNFNRANSLNDVKLNNLEIKLIPDF